MAYFVIPLKTENRRTKCDLKCLHLTGKVKGPYFTYIGAIFAARKMPRVDAASSDNKRRFLILKGSLYTPIYILEIVDQICRIEIVNDVIRKIKHVVHS